MNKESPLVPIGRSLFLLLAGALLLAAGSGVTVSSAEKHRGLCWVAGKPVDGAHMKAAAEMGANWISQTPFGWQKEHDHPEVILYSGEKVWWGERDEGLKVTTALARARGIKVMLKPHVWMHDPEHGHWRGTIAMNSPGDWRAWFKSYRTFILHYARLAQEAKADALCIGTELRLTVLEKPEEWRKLIAEIRKVFDGELTYAANWDREVYEVPFWKELDYIGVQAYFPLAGTSHPSRETMVRGWEPHRKKLKALSEKTARPVLFTEAGYRSGPGAASRPWEWPDHGSPPASAEDLRLQADAWRALFDSLWEEPWFLGVHAWKWHPHHRQKRQTADRAFSPQGKPAQEVLRKYFRQGPKPNLQR